MSLRVWRNFGGTSKKAMAKHCFFCRRVCCVCLCVLSLPLLERLPMLCWTPGTKHLASLALHRDTCYHKSEKNRCSVQECKHTDLLVPIYRSMQPYTCNLKHMVLRICHVAQQAALTQSPLFIPGGWPHKILIRDKKPWSKLMWFIFFCLHAIGQTATTVFSYNHTKY